MSRLLLKANKFKPILWALSILCTCILSSSSMAFGQLSVMSRLDQVPTMEAYRVDTQRRIKRAWFPAKGYESKVVTVLFLVQADGTMTHLRLGQSSGVAIVDNSALNALKNAAPFRPLPSGAGEEIAMQMKFNYDVFTGRMPEFGQLRN